MGSAVGWIHWGARPRVIVLGLIACGAAGCSQAPARFSEDPRPATGTIAAPIHARAVVPRPGTPVPPESIPVVVGPPDAAVAPERHAVAPAIRPAEIARPYRGSAPAAASARKEEKPAVTKPPAKLAALKPVAPRLPTPRPPAPNLSAPKLSAANPPAPNPPARSPAEAPASADLLQQTDAAPSFRWPVRGQVIAGFGPKPDGQRNDGIDIAVPENTPIKAADDGVVIYSGNQLKSFGNLVLVRHGNDYVTAYAYAKEVRVKKGDTIKSGEVIGTSGQTGNAAAPEVHFEIRKGSTPVDPIRLLHGA